MMIRERDGDRVEERRFHHFHYFIGDTSVVSVISVLKIMVCNRAWLALSDSDSLPT